MHSRVCVVDAGWPYAQRHQTRRSRNDNVLCISWIPHTCFQRANQMISKSPISNCTRQIWDYEVVLTLVGVFWLDPKNRAPEGPHRGKVQTSSKSTYNQTPKLPRTSFRNRENTLKVGQIRLFGAAFDLYRLIWGLRNQIRDLGV